MPDSVDNASSTDGRLPLSGAGRDTEIEGWACSIAAAAMKIVWAMPVGTASSDVRRRIARAEALRIGRKHRQAQAPPPVPEGAAPPSRNVFSEG